MNQLLSISLAVLMFASSMGMTLATHYCGGHAMESSIALSKVDLDCGMGMAHEDAMNGNAIRPNTCCENEYVYVEIDDQFNTSIRKISVDDSFILAFASVYLRTSFSGIERQPNSSYAPPPLLKQDIQVLYQKFLI